MSYSSPQALPGWNHDWTSDDRWFFAYFDSACINMYIDALNERLKAIGETLIPKYIDGSISPRYLPQLTPYTETFSSTGATTTDSFTLSHVPIACRMLRATIYVGTTAVALVQGNNDEALGITVLGSPAAYPISGGATQVFGTFSYSWNIPPGPNSVVVTYTQATYTLGIVSNADSYASRLESIGRSWANISLAAASRLFDPNGRFVPAYDSSGGAINYTGHLPLTAGDRFDPDELDDGTINMPIWSYKIQKKRFPRLIKAISDAHCQQPLGMPNFDYLGNPITYGAAATGQIALLTDHTSPNVGKLHTYSGGWNLYTGSAKAPDTVVLTPGTQMVDLGSPYGVQEQPNGYYYPVGTVNYPFAPDYFNGEYLNELRDLINQAVAVRYGKTDIGSGVEGGPGLGGDVALYWVAGGENSGASRHETDGDDSFGDYTVAQANYASGRHLLSNTGVAPVCNSISDGITLGTIVTYQVYRAWGTPQIENLPMAGVYSYQVYFVAAFVGAPGTPTKWGLPYTAYPADTYPNASQTFDANGDGVTYKTNYGFSASSIISTDTYEGSQFGSTGCPDIDTGIVTAFVSDGMGGYVSNPDVPPSKDYGVKGYAPVALFALVRYDVAGGFTYVK
jgi:hypothetical protein